VAELTALLTELVTTELVALDAAVLVALLAALELAALDFAEELVAELELSVPVLELELHATPEAVAITAPRARAERSNWVLRGAVVILRILSREAAKCGWLVIADGQRHDTSFGGSCRVTTTVRC
jgi:hypothetical protein